MLEPEEVDEGYFTPIASTTLASIFRENLKNEESANSSLKYKAQQSKKIEQCTKSDDPNATQLVYSCSLTAYEWVNGAHKYQKKVGFAMIQTITTGLCKIILYAPDKSTLSCTTVSAQLEVTLKGTMISLYDDHKKYWGLCFNDKTIREVTKLLQKENVVIINYETVLSAHIDNDSFKPEVENADSEGTSDETDRSSVVEENISTSNNERASILNRISNVGHAILPSTPVSPVKKSSMMDRLNTKELFSSSEKLHILSDVSESNKPLASSDNNFTRSIAVQANANNTEHDDILPSNVKQIGLQHHVTSVPLVNNQIFTFVNGCIVPVHMPVLDTLECGISSAEIEIIVQKLTRLQGHLKTKEILKINACSQNTERDKICSCKNETDGSKHLDSIPTSSFLGAQNEDNLSKISNLEELIREKNDVIIKLQNEVKTEEQKSITLTQKHECNSIMLKNEIEDLKQALIKKEKEFANMIPQSEASSLIANTIKKLMNDTFRALSSNFEIEVNYSGYNVKGILAAVIKKCTVESLSALPNPRGICYPPVEPTD